MRTSADAVFVTLSLAMFLVWSATKRRGSMHY